MSDQIFIELYLDEDVSVLIAELLRARGFVVTTTLEAGNLGGTDREQLEFVIAVRRRAGEIAMRLLPILNSRTPDEIQNQLIYI